MARLQTAMVEMHKDQAGQALLESFRVKGIAAADDAEWDDVRALGLQLLDERVRQ